MMANRAMKHSEGIFFSKPVIPVGSSSVDAVSLENCKLFSLVQTESSRRLLKASNLWSSSEFHNCSKISTWNFVTEVKHRFAPRLNIDPFHDSSRARKLFRPQKVFLFFSSQAERENFSSFLFYVQIAICRLPFCMPNWLSKLKGGCDSFSLRFALLLSFFSPARRRFIIAACRNNCWHNGLPKVFINADEFDGNVTGGSLRY